MTTTHHHSKKAIGLAAFLLLIVAALLPFARPASAAEKTVYLSAAGSATADGSAANPFGSLTDAITAVADGGTIVLTDRFPIKENGEAGGLPVFCEPSHKGTIRFTSVDGTTDYRQNGACFLFPKKLGYEMAGPAAFDGITFTTAGTEVYWIGNFHAMHFGADFLTKNEKSTAKYLYAIGGYYAPDKGVSTAGNTSISIDGGSFLRVIGFSYVKGYQTCTFTGKSVITVNGGQIDRIYGGSALNHHSGSTDITVNGGTVGEIFTAGDATRPLDGYARVTLNGGTVRSLTFNNIKGTGTLILDGGTLGRYTESYGNDTLKQAAAGSARILQYNSIAYSADFIRSLGSFTSVEKHGTVFVAAGGTGDGLSAERPLGSFDEAIRKLAAGGGTLSLSGTVTLGDFTEPAHKEPITVTGGTVVADRYRLAGDTAFSDTVLSIATLDAGTNALRVDGVLTAKTDVRGERVALEGGSYGTVTLTGENASLLLCGDADRVTLANGENLLLSLLSGKVGEVSAACSGTVEIECAADVARFTLSCADAPSLLLRLGKTEIGDGSFAVGGNATLIYDAANTPQSLIDRISPAFSSTSTVKTAFVAAGGSGDGFSRQQPAGDLATAFQTVADGGEVVLLTDLSLTRATELPAHTGTVTLRSEQNATLHIATPLTFGGPVVLRELTLTAASEYAKLIFGGHRAVIEDTVVAERDAGITNYLTLVAGNNSNTAVGHTDLTVAGGNWQTVYGGSAVGTYDDCDYRLTIAGGSYYGKVYASGVGTQKGNATLTVTGGTFYAGLYGTASEVSRDSFLGDIAITISGGVVYGKIAPGIDYDQSINGSYTLTVRGGDFRHLSTFEGAQSFFGNCQSHIVFDGVDENAPLTGTYTYENPIRRTADPRIALVDGMYYYVFTSSSTLRVYKAANVTDLAYDEGVLVWDARKYASALGNRTANIWPSELQYFSEEEFGDAAGWYLFFSTYEDPGDGNTDGSTRRSYVLKSKTNDLQGTWVNPVTGKPGVPEPFGSDTESWVNTVDWTAGESTLRYNGKVYALWIEQRDRGTSDFRQIMYLSEMKNPWTVTGKVLKLVEPEYDWERVGHAYEEPKDLWYPAVVEGATPIVSDDNRLFVLYAASGYWTTDYALGQMTFTGGNLFDIANWKKNPTPVFSKNAEVNGTGGPSILTMPDGSGRYILYHGYLGTDTSSRRYCFMEPYTVDETGVHIGVNGHPSPLSTAFTIPYNPTPLAKRTTGFTANKPTNTDPPTTDAPQSGAVTTDTPTPSTTGISTPIVIGAIAFALVFAGAALLLIRAKKKKTQAAR